MSARLSAAVVAGRTAAALSRRLGLGGGTVIAGHVAQRLDPGALRRIVARLPRGAAIISGTNGKTTTARLIASTLRLAGVRPLHNRAGANLLTGLTTAVVEDASARGRPRAHMGVFEVDEATVPAAVAEVQPRLVLLTNLFRDQLDRYGEVGFVASLWRETVRDLPNATRLVLNADDPLVAHLGAERSDAMYFGIGDVSVGSEQLPHALDARLCGRCAHEYSYTISFYGHLGHYTCPSCGLGRPTPDIEATQVELRGDEGARVTIRTPGGPFGVELRLPGLYNVYNAVAATAALVGLGVPNTTIQQGLEGFSAAFGRLERIEVEQRRLLLTLVKNPVGFTEVLRTILSATPSANLLIAINDLFADGTDISWLWDVDFEMLPDRVGFVVCSGARADDMAVRLKYALVPTDRLYIEPDLRRALEAALARSQAGETLYVLPTYTAMLAIRDVLRRTGYVHGFWED